MPLIMVHSDSSGSSSSHNWVPSSRAHSNKQVAIDLAYGIVLLRLRNVAFLLGGAAWRQFISD